MNKNCLLIATVLLFLSACEISLDVGNRSGTIKDDYIEEPLSKNSIKYEAAHQTSNEILNYLQTRNFEKIAQNHVSSEVKQQLNPKNLELLSEQAVHATGKIKNYKKMQWGFVPKEVEGSELLYSIKVVEHEKVKLNYFFVFKKDSDYKKVVGIYIKHIAGARPPGLI